MRCFARRRVPLDEIFLIPLRLDDCVVPPHLKQIQYLDLFPDWDAGVSGMLAVMKAQDELASASDYRWRANFFLMDSASLASGASARYLV